MKILKILLILILISLTSINVHSLGLSPSRITFDFIAEEEIEAGACITNSNTRYLFLNATGSLKDNITLKGDNLIDGNILDSSKNPCFSYIIKLPKEPKYPGLNINTIFVTEMPEEKREGVSVKVSIGHQIYMNVPYPGKYVEINSFNPKNTNAKEIVPIYIIAQSKGVDTINFVSGKVKIFDHTQTLIATLDTDKKTNIKTNEEIYLYTEWDSKDYREGNYEAELILTYDSLTANRTSSFKLGGLDVNLIRYTENITIGGLQPFIATVDSIWSESINNIRITAQVYNKTDNRVETTFETVTRTVPPFGTTSVGGYIDTEAAGLGEHGIKMTLYYDNTSKEYDKTLNIIPEPVIEPIKEKSNIFSTKNILIATIIILLIILIVVLLSIFFPKKKDGEKPVQNIVKQQ